MRIALLAIVLSAGVASADSAKDRSARAAKLFEEGRDLARVANYQDACDHFAQSYELDPAAGTAVNFADCQEHLGHLARAWQLFDAAASAADHDKNPVRAQYARDRANVLVPRLGVVVVKIADDRLDRITLQIGDRTIPAGAEVHERVDPGDIQLVASAPERRFESTVHVAAGAISTVDVPLLVHPAAEAPGRRRSYVVAAIALGGAGVASLAISGLFGLDAARFYNDAFTHGQCFNTVRGDECTPEGLKTVDTAHSRANVGTGFAVVGVALVATGVGVFVFAPRDGALEVAPAATPTSAGVTVSGRF